MKKLDLHGKTHEESEFLVSVFIENNIDNLPIEIVTGNSGIMKSIVMKIVKKHNLVALPKTDYNLGCLLIYAN